MKDNYKPRLIDKTLSKYLATFGAVCVEGPKWCGKTWACENQASSVFRLADPTNNFQNRELAKIDIYATLSGDKPHLIDEWQEMPEIWDAIRYKVDEIGKTGQFLLTGSSTPHRKGIYHSGAGRIATLKMDTLSLWESEDSCGAVSLIDLFEGKVQNKLTGDVDLKHLADLIVRGGWPAMFSSTSKSYSSLMAKQYIDAIINEDINRLEGTKRNIDKMRILLRSLARNESTTVSMNTLRNDMQNMDGSALDDETIADYLGVLKRMFLIENQEPFSPNIRSSVRVKQAKKLHFADPSIPCAILGLNRDSLLNNITTMGFLFESLCEHDLRVYAKELDGKLYHYQDYKQREIDAIVELPDGRWGAFEIKLGSRQIDEAAENLKSISKSFEETGNTPTFLAVICGMSNAVYRRADGVYVLPLTALKD